jgi:hypothetical protein
VQSVATADSKDTWIEVPTKKKTAIRKETMAAGQKLKKEDKTESSGMSSNTVTTNASTDHVIGFAVLAQLPSSPPNKSSIATSVQQEAAFVDKTKTKTKKKPVVNVDEERLKKAHELDELVASILDPTVAPAPTKQLVPTNGGSTYFHATQATSAVPAKTISIPKKLVTQNRNDKRQQSRIDHAVATAKEHGLADAAAVDVARKHLKGLVAGAKHHRDNELASEKKFRRTLKTLHEERIPLSSMLPRPWRESTEMV